jgi:hypothetical protein
VIHQEQQQQQLRQHQNTQLHMQPTPCNTRYTSSCNKHYSQPTLPDQIRDTDLDTLERLVGCLTWGDIEAEDSRHLAESSFVKVFRLAQLLLEYLLYVQDSLKHTNSVLELSRCGAGALYMSMCWLLTVTIVAQNSVTHSE